MANFSDHFQGTVCNGKYYLDSLFSLVLADSVEMYRGFENQLLDFLNLH